MPKNIITPSTTEPNTEDSVTILNKCGVSSNPLFKFIPNIPAAHVADVKHNDAMDRQRLASKNLFRAASILASIKSLYCCGVEKGTKEYQMHIYLELEKNYCKLVHYRKMKETLRLNNQQNQRS